MEITSEKSQVLGTPPSCVAFCPAYPEYFAVGTYVLHKDESEAQAGDETPAAATEPQKRTGCLDLYKLKGTDM